MSDIQLIPRKTIGLLTVYERKPKPKGEHRYIVIGHVVPVEFARYAKAVRWMKDVRGK
jgi:hypothetical protein